jgi:dihydroorotase
VAQGFYPDSISTDLHNGSMNGPMFDMPVTMSKMMALGMGLEAVIRASTWNPAQQIQRPELGHLTVGAVADVAVLRVQEGDFGFGDAAGGRVAARQRLLAEMTVKDGRIVFDWNLRGAGKDWKSLPSDYGIRPGIDFIVPPPK